MKKSILFFCAVLLAAQANPMNQKFAKGKQSFLNAQANRTYLKSAKGTQLQKTIGKAIKNGNVRPFKTLLQVFDQNIKGNLVYRKSLSLEPFIFLIMQKAYKKKKNVLPGGSAVSAIDFVRALDGYFIDIDECNSSNEKPLHHAIMNGDVQTVQYLLQKGANPNGLRNQRKRLLLRKKKKVAFEEEEKAAFQANANSYTPG